MGLIDEFLFFCYVIGRRINEIQKFPSNGKSLPFSLKEKRSDLGQLVVMQLPDI